MPCTQATGGWSSLSCCRDVIVGRDEIDGDSQLGRTATGFPQDRRERCPVILISAACYSVATVSFLVDGVMEAPC